MKRSRYGLLVIFAPMLFVDAANASNYTRCWASSGGKLWLIVYGQDSAQQCRSLAQKCTRDTSAVVTFSTNPVLVIDDHVRCETWPQSATAPERPVSPPPAAKKPLPANAPAVLPGQAQTRVYEFTSGRKNSGKWSEWSNWYELCSALIPEDFTIFEDTFSLRGDRRECGVHAECVRSKSTESQVCWRFRLQGHGERLAGIIPIDNPNEGRRESEGLLTVKTRNYLPPSSDGRTPRSDGDALNVPLRPPVLSFPPPRGQATPGRTR